MTEKIKYNSADCIISWVCIVLGYLYCRTFPVIAKPFYGLLFVIIVYLLTAVLLIKKKIQLSPSLWFVPISSLALCSALFVSGSELDWFLVFTYATGAYCYFIYRAFGNKLEKGFSELMIADFFRALVVYPILSFVELFSALLAEKKKGKAVLYILLGIALALVPTVIVFSLLSYDSDFTYMMKNVFRLDFENIFSQITSIAFGVVVGMYLFGLYSSSEYKRFESTLNADTCHKAANAVRILPGITAIAACVPVLFVYGVFFASQWKYYVSGFVGVLPDETSYAEYARSGFFELCAVAVINLIIIIVLSIFLKRRNGKSVLLKTVCTVFSLVTLTLISTAAAKLVLYIKRFGLTSQRIYAAWFMSVLALVFVLIIVKQFAARFKLIPAVAVVSVVLLAVITLPDLNGIIAKYNVDRYIDGSIAEVDVDTVASLGDSGTQQLIRLGKAYEKRVGGNLAIDVNEDRGYSWEKAQNPTDDEEIYNKIVLALYCQSYMREKTFANFTLRRAEAEKALSDAGIKITYYEKDKQDEEDTEEKTVEDTEEYTE